MIDRELQQPLDRAANRLRSFRFWTGMSVVWIVIAAAVGLIFATTQMSGRVVPGGASLAFVVAVISSLIVLIWSRQSAGNQRRLAERIESHFPQLNATLITAVEQQPEQSSGKLGYLQHVVVEKAIRHSETHDWTQIVSPTQMGLARASTAFGLILFCVSALFLTSLNKQLKPTHSSSLAFNDVVLEGMQYKASVEPGDAEIERGSSLLVLARFANKLPPESMLIYTGADEQEQTVSMAQSLDDPVFGGRIATVNDSLKYRIRFGEQTTRDFEIKVFDYPNLLQTDAKLVFPGYTKQEEKFVQDVRRISAVEGTDLTLLCRVNKPLASAQYKEQLEDGEVVIPLQVDAADPLTYTTTFKLERSRELTLHLTDDAGRANKFPTKLVINVVTNRPPDIKLAQPTKDIEVSPIEEVDLAASAWDDFGIQRVGISYSIPGKVDKEVPLGDSFPPKERIQTQHLLAFEDLKAEPDQLLSWYFWAEDIGPAGEIRRTASDMFFAEVRPFEEIFRQGQQPAEGEQQQQQQQQGSQNAQQAQQLAELQKQIINATWKVIRRETREKASPEFEGDVRLIIESQQAAIKQVEELEQNIQDQQSLSHVDTVKQEMRKAVSSLESAAGSKRPSVLNEALGHEPAAYQALLRLRAREHEVVQGQQSQQQQQSQQSQSQRMQRQLDQLKLKEDANRYAQEQQAQTEQEQQTREDRQVLNRLRELAQRQSDLNERIKELQGALEAAQTEEERAEAERQLKRLREEQEEILQDTEELQERMQQPENQERMAEQSQQLEQARENVRQSAEALQQRMVTQAANEGTRAQDELNDLKEEFQRQTSGQFEEQMREMRQQAQELKQNEEKIAEQLKNMNEGKGESATSLRDSDDRQGAQQQVADQKKRLEELTNRMRETIEEAEATQPLLAEKLYDSIRETRKADPQKALEATDMLLRRGFLDDALDQEQVARKGIERLAEGVEQAADQVLGDGTETLRRALGELDRLNTDLDREIAQAEGRQPGQRTGQQDPMSPFRNQNPLTDPLNSNSSGGQQQNGQSSQAQQQNDQQSQSGQQPGQQQGQQQSNQQQPGEQSMAPQGQQPGQQQQGQQQGQQPGQQSGQQPGQQQGQRPGEQQGQQSGQQPGSQQPGQQGQQGQQQSGQQPGGQQPGGQQPGQQQPGQQSGGQQPGGEQQGQQSGQGGGQQRQAGGQRNAGGGGGGLDQFLNNGNTNSGNQRRASPFSGDDFVNWSDRLRDVEEIVDDPELRAEAARIREEARELRREMLNNEAPPQWDIIKERVANPLTQLQNRVSEELLKRTGDGARIPIDKDPVPTQYENAVRRYYERLGSSQ